MSANEGADNMQMDLQELTVVKLKFHFIRHKIMCGNKTRNETGIMWCQLVLWREGILLSTIRMNRFFFTCAALRSFLGMWSDYVCP
jgi:hypothetical protein